ncbi:MAG: tripartite tricarboxylate transporter substrate binding protein, partial [Pseudoclavibacter sp.]
MATAVAAIGLLVFTGCGVTNQGGGGGGDGDGAYFEGERITMIVPFDAGGASDTFSRMLAGYLSEYLEGNPEVVVENVPGGGQKEGLNQFERSERDGLTLGMGSGGILVSSLIDTE